MGKASRTRNIEKPERTSSPEIEHPGVELEIILNCVMV